MKFISVCSGIEAASCAWGPLGWQAVAFSEIELFPSAVLAHRFPDTPNLGDMTRWREWPEDLLAQADVFTGGTPCQAFSVAGSRRSLDDARGNLSLTFCEIADAIDHVRVARGDQPAIIVWENVPGVLSTADNAFGCFLAGLAGEDEPLFPPGGKWTNAGLVHGPARSVAWRTLDAQYFGVAQRRRRVWVVASARDGFDPAAVLFEWDRVRRDSAPRRESWKDTAGSTGDGVARCVTAGEMKRQDWESCTMVAQPIAFDTTQVTSAANYSSPKPGDQCHPLAAGAHAPPIAFPANLSGTQHASAENLAPSMGAKNPTAVAVDCYNGAMTGDVAATMGTSGSPINSAGPQVMAGMSVRRLTPRECERLQGFPDDWTLIPWRKKPASECPDGPRYKALGNSWAVPCARWIGARISDAVCIRMPELAP